MRPGELPGDYEVAIHESAHAVADCVLGTAFAFVTINPSDDGAWRGRVQQTPAQWAAMSDEALFISLAAPGHAEHLILGWDSHVCIRPHAATDDNLAMVYGCHLLYDRRQAEQGEAARVPTEDDVRDFLRPFRGKARVLVHLHRDWISNVAQALVLRRTLTQDEVQGLKRKMRPVVRRPGPRTRQTPA